MTLLQRFFWTVARSLSDFPQPFKLVTCQFILGSFSAKFSLEKNAQHVA
jgi:hypothetical protein